MKLWLIALASAAGFGLAAQEAFADRGRGGHSSASRPQHHSRPHHNSRPRHHANPGRHHAHPRHHYHHYHGRSHGYSGWWWPGLVIAPAFAAGYYYDSAPVYAAPPVPPPPLIPSLNDGYWYYCADNRLYYPYAVECPSGWQQVTPR